MASTNTQLQDGDGASFPSGSSSWKYDVFLSFRGEDTRNGFVDHLYSALHQRLIFTFKDDLKLERGESISPTLLKAIEESRFAIVVFSKNYASSKWCLEELVKILECQKTRGLTVLPVFHKVDPSDLRKQRGSIGEVFAKHEQDSSKVEKEKQKVQTWKNALMEAANISGWDSEIDGPEAKLIRNIAIHILNRLGDNGSSILEDVVGLHPRVAKVMSLLEMGLDFDAPRIVGICGMGGIGKTTIAKALYLQIRSQFDGSSYHEKVRETFEKNGLESLQRSLLVDICSVLDSDIKIKNIDLLGTIRNVVRNKRVLIVLDDVDQPNQLDALVGNPNWFGSGSKIIITTRDSHLLAKYEESHVYNVEGLNDEEAFKLFCCNAFRSKQPMRGFEHLIKSAVDYAKGVPLALIILGSFLIGRNVNQWQSAIHRLREEPNPDIQKVLKLSYNGLGCKEQAIFLDIACFFKWNSEVNYCTVVNILDACGFHPNIGISVLKEKALVMIRDNKIDMHDLIQEMGWHIVNEESPKEPGRRSRLWDYKDIFHTLTKKMGTEAVETIVLDSHEKKDISLSPDTFSKMSKLRLLKLSNVQLPNGLDYISNDLRLLDWHGYPLKYLPPNFLPDNLVKLNMLSSCLKQPWNGRMCLDKLKYVNLSYSSCITEIPDFTQVANLEELILDDCTKLVEINPSIKAIKRLMVLNLRDCKYLQVLPTGYWLKSLKQLNLSDCSKLKNVSEVLAFTKCLISLYLDGTSVKELPVEHLNNLKFISMRDCKELTSLPSGIIGLKLLEILDVSGCSKLSKLPENLEGLQRLQGLYADFTAIKELPVGYPSNLRFISLVDCKELTSLPSGICGLKLLETLDVSGCSKLNKLPENLGGLQRLRVLDANFTTIEQLPSSMVHLKELVSFFFRGGVISTSFPLGLHSLRILDLRNCNLSEGFLPDDQGSLSSLTDLILDGTNIISLPPSIAYLPNLHFLGLMDCKKLKTLPCLPPSISHIDASGCTSLEIVQNLHLCDEGATRIKLINCHALAKNQPGLHIELIKNHLENFAHLWRCTIVFPGRDIPKCFSYQNNTGHYVRIQLRPDWYQRFRGFVVCAVFEAKEPIDAAFYVECYGICNDVLASAYMVYSNEFHFGSDHFLLFYWATGGEIYVNDLKTWTEIFFYFTSSCPEKLVPVKCAVEMIYENDKEWAEPCTSIQQSDCDEFGSIESVQGVESRKRSHHDYDYNKADTGEQPSSKRLKDDAAQGRDSQFELSEIYIQNIRNSIKLNISPLEVVDALSDRFNVDCKWTDRRLAEPSLFK